MPASVARAWVRTGLPGAQSIDVRWQESRETVYRTIPLGHPLRDTANLPKDEISIDEMNAALEKYRAEKAAATAPSPQLIAAFDELNELRHQYQVATFEIRERQKGLPAAHDWRLKVLRSLTAD